VRLFTLEFANSSSRTAVQFSSCAVNRPLPDVMICCAMFVVSGFCVLSPFNALTFIYTIVVHSALVVIARSVFVFGQINSKGCGRIFLVKVGE